MASDPDHDTTRTVVKTYLPEYQRDEWDEHAEELDMSRSEFVKAMVQAGRRGFEGPSINVSGTERSADTISKEGSPTGHKDSESLEETVLRTLSEDEYLSWDKLLGAITNDIESRLEETLQDLQSKNKVRYSGRHGGYTLES